MSGDLVYAVTIAKQRLADAVGVDSSLLHVPVGLACFGLFWALFRGRPRGAVWSAVAVLCLQLVNECVDAVQWMRWTGAVNWREAFGDVLLTMTAPVAIVLMRGLWGGRASPARGA